LVFHPVAVNGNFVKKKLVKRQLYTKEETRYIKMQTFRIHKIEHKHAKNINTLRTGSFKLFKRSLPGFLTILAL